jgi:hypothetical protein
LLDGHFAIVLSGVQGLLTLPKQQPASISHDAVNTLVVDAYITI